ncbi:hypothetical protein [Ferruginibacter albus]|uniref:hypothetical protein n=1 Tax=Ferruginibacter albus TaxID=2875540 RepID=UPI001CC4E55C|nr:hypothetical protein [Ferruginibacter albus]UAY53309.1 hypothetical protein K9M53_06465 [Ferruginibacter albus]
MTKYIFIFLVILNISSCRKKSTTIVNSFKKYPFPSRIDSFQKVRLKQFEEYLNIPSIENGTDSFEVRIYMYAAFFPGHDLFLIKSSPDSLIKKHYHFSPASLHNPDGTKSTYESQFSFMHNFFFTRGDTAFKNLLAISNLDTLPTQVAIAGLNGGCFDGVGWTVEIATKNSYRELTYYNPDCYKASIQNKMFADFMTKFSSLLPPDEMSWYHKQRD